jgi:hypothetical protein
MIFNAAEYEVSFLCWVLIYIDDGGNWKVETHKGRFIYLENFTSVCYLGTLVSINGIGNQGLLNLYHCDMPCYFKTLHIYRIILSSISNVIHSHAYLISLQVLLHCTISCCKPFACTKSLFNALFFHHVI